MSPATRHFVHNKPSLTHDTVINTQNHHIHPKPSHTCAPNHHPTMTQSTTHHTITKHTSTPHTQLGCTYTTFSEELELLPMDSPRSSELLPLSGRPFLGTDVIVCAQVVVARERGLPQQKQPHCLLETM